MIPDVYGQLVTQDELHSEGAFMPPRFVEDGYETPFFVLNYSKSFTLWGIVFLMLLPLLLAFH